jgi:hypothetical protein
MLVFELRRDAAGAYFVRVVYNGRQIALPVLQAAGNGLYELDNMTQYVALLPVFLPAASPCHSRVRYLAPNLPSCAKKLASVEPFQAWALQVSLTSELPPSRATVSSGSRR